MHYGHSAKHRVPRHTGRVTAFRYTPSRDTPTPGCSPLFRAPRSPSFQAACVRLADGALQHIAASHAQNG